jgi:hypothetical protein
MPYNLITLKPLSVATRKRGENQNKGSKMAWNSVTYKCGHTAHLQIYGSNAAQANKVAWLRDNQVCPDCAALAKANVAQASAAQNVANGLPTLEGSAKQIAWAESIRADKVAQIDKLMEYIRAHARVDTPDRQAVIGAVVERLTALKNETKAGVWIDNRLRRYDNDYLGQLLRDLGGKNEN